MFGITPGGTDGGGIDGLLLEEPIMFGALIGCVGVPGWVMVADIGCMGEEVPSGVDIGDTISDELK